MSNLSIGALVFALVVGALFVFAVIRKSVRGRSSERDVAKLKPAIGSSPLTGVLHPSPHNTSYQGIALMESQHVPENRAFLLTDVVLAQAVDALDDLTLSMNREIPEPPSEKTKSGVQYLLSFSGGSK